MTCMSFNAAEGSEMSTQLKSLSETVKRGLYEVPAEKVAAAILEWHIGDRLGDKGLTLRLHLSPTAP